ncbi:MAG TPA: hypothetical protein VJ124_08205 [Pyrinomonadaceae bacterium]|nr:hypothetical protein [Pyrinomonadaceae bacterium]
MTTLRANLFGITICALLFVVPAQGTQESAKNDEEFGPVVRAYLGYLKNEQEVVDDRVSRHEVSAWYYRRNSNRIRALRQIAIRIARESRNDYLPELEAVARDEMGLLFERPPRPETLRIGEILRSTFRFLGAVRSGEQFYVFARLDPYEQAELLENPKPSPLNNQPASLRSSNPITRSRRVTSP